MAMRDDTKGPRFFCVSEQGCCIQWNAPCSEDMFAEHAKSYLDNHKEAGYIWDVCVYYSVPNRKTKQKVFFRIILDMDTLEDQIEHKKFLRQVKDYRRYLTHMLYFPVIEDINMITVWLLMFPEYMNAKIQKRVNRKTNAIQKLSTELNV